MVTTGKMFTLGNNDKEQYELIHTEDGSFMYDGFDCFIEVSGDEDDGFHIKGQYNNLFHPVED